MLVRNATGEENAYNAVSLGETWSVLSLSCFLVSLLTRQAIRVLPFPMQGWHLMPPLAVLLVPAISGLGVLLALPRRRRALGRLAFWANLIVCAFGSLVVLLIWIWRVGRA